MRNAIASATITDVEKLRNDAVRICIDKYTKIDKYGYNAIDYKLITRESTSIILMVIHKEIGGKSLVIRQRLILGGISVDLT